MSFSSDVARFGAKATSNMDIVVRRATFELGRMLINKTAVDTGLLRSSWFFGYNSDTTSTASVDMTSYRKSKGLQSTFSVKEKRKADRQAKRDQSGGASMARLNEWARIVEAGTVSYITNNLPYAMAIMEFGHSRQTPIAAARTSVMQIQAMVNTFVRALP